MTDNAFSEAERAAVYRAIGERRDMRHFSGGTVEPELLQRLLEAAHQAPSVGLMQPWRFIRISDRALRGKIQSLVEEERIRTAEALGERTDEFMKLKVEGINDCAEVLDLAAQGSVDDADEAPGLHQADAWGLVGGFQKSAQQIRFDAAAGEVAHVAAFGYCPIHRFAFGIRKCVVCHGPFASRLAPTGDCVSSGTPSPTVGVSLLAIASSRVGANNAATATGFDGK